MEKITIGGVMRVLFDYHELWDVVESGVFALAIMQLRPNE